MPFFLERVPTCGRRGDLISRIGRLGNHEWWRGRDPARDGADCQCDESETLCQADCPEALICATLSCTHGCPSDDDYHDGVVCAGVAETDFDAQGVTNLGRCYCLENLTELKCAQLDLLYRAARRLVSDHLDQSKPCKAEAERRV